jgi:hypothetical protein
MAENWVRNSAIVVLERVREAMTASSSDEQRWTGSTSTVTLLIESGEEVPTQEEAWAPNTLVLAQ